MARAKKTHPEHVDTPEYTSVSMKAARQIYKEAVPAKEYMGLVDALEQTSQSLTVENDLQNILVGIANILGKSLGARIVNFWTFSEDKKTVHIEAAYGMQQQYIDHSREEPLASGEAWIGRAMQSGQAWATSDVQKDPYLPKSWLPAVKKQNYHGLLCTPLIRKNETFGGMCIYYNDVHKFKYFEMSIATIVANQAATAVANARIIGDLQSEQNKTVSIINSLQDGVILYNTDGEVTLFNPRAQELLWIEAKDILGKKITKEIADKNDYIKNLHLIVQQLEEHKDYEPVEITTEEPRRIILETVKIPVRDSEEYEMGTMHVLRDITREKESDKLKTNFITVASHQLRTPISSLRWALDSLRGDAKTSLSEEQKHTLDSAFDVSGHLAELVNDILDASRIEEGRFGYEFTKQDILPVVTKVYNDLTLKAASRKVSITANTPEAPLPAVAIDAQKIELAVQNIVDNAIKYTDSGGKVTISFVVKEDTLEIVVSDTGIGIPEKDSKFIFNKFFRAENAVRFQTEGSGLGLYIAKSITEKHRGTVSFKSEVNKGTDFILSFPIGEENMPKEIPGDDKGK